MLSKFIYKNLSASNPTIVTFLDYSKAFDTVDHNILLSKLHNMGIRGVCILLIRNYLQDRKQIVNVNRSKSQSVVTNFGVQQGSILVSLLFILYINDLLTIDSDLIAYADETAAKLKARSWD